MPSCNYQDTQFTLEDTATPRASPICLDSIKSKLFFDATDGICKDGMNTMNSSYRIVKLGA